MTEQKKLLQVKHRMHLCWTISPTYSCVLEYTAGIIPEADLFRMAESVAGDLDVAKLINKVIRATAHFKSGGLLFSAEIFERGV